MGHQTKDIGHQTKDIGHQTKDIRHQTKDIRHQTKDIGHQTKDIRHMYGLNNISEKVFVLFRRRGFLYSEGDLWTSLRGHCFQDREPRMGIWIQERIQMPVP